jgi:hypothetical protein
LGQLVEHFLAAAGYANPRSVSNEPLGYCGAYTRTRSGNEGYFPI